MAKQIKGIEIIESNHLADAIKSANELLSVYQKLDEQIKKTASQSKTKIVSIAPKDVQSIAQINAEVKKSIELQKTASVINKEKLKLQKQLKQSTDEEVKAKLRFQEVQREQKKLLKEQIALENKQLGTLKKLQIANSKLRRERENLNLEDKKGLKRLKEINTQLDKNNERIRKYSDNLKKQKINIGNYFGSTLISIKKLAGALGIIGGIALVTKSIKDAVLTFTIFEQANANLASVLGTTKDKITELTESAKEIGKTSAFTATDITKLQTELAKLGFTTDEILKSTDAIQALAQATKTDLAEAATIVGSTIRAFGLEASEAARVTDALSLSTTKTALDMQKLSTALPIVSKTAKTAGVSLERTTSLLGVLADNGIDASTSATALRNIFLELSKQGLTWNEAMDKINNATDKNLVAMDLFGKRGATVAITLAENTDRANSLTKALESSGGTAKKMADTQLDTLTGSVTKMKSAWEGFILSMEDGNGTFSKTLRSVIDFIAQFLNYISGAEDAENQTSSLVKTVAFLGKVLAGLIPAFIALNVVMSANPIGLVVLAIAGLVGYLVILHEKISPLIDLWSKATNSVGDFGKALVSTAKFIFDYLTPFGLLLKGIQMLVGSNEDATKSTERLTDAERKHKAEIADKIDTQNRALKIGKELIDQSQKEIANSQILIDALIDENTTREERSKIIDKLNKDYPELIGNIDLETASTQQLINVKRELIRQILSEAVEKRKAQALEEVTSRIIDAQIKLIFAKTDAEKKYLNTIITQNTAGIRKINDVAELVKENLNDVADKMDLSESFRANSTEIDKLEAKLKKLTVELDKAITSGDKARANVIRNQIIDLKAKLNELDNVRAKTLEDILGKDKEIEVTVKPNGSGQGGKITKKDIIEDDIKIDLEIDTNSDGLKRLYQTIDEISITEIDDLDSEKIESSIELRLNKLQDFYHKWQTMSKENQQVIIDNVKQSSQLLTESLIEVSNLLDSRFNEKIEKLKTNLEDSKQRINSLEQQAQLGNLDANESIKAEKQKQAQTKAEIEKLEKKKKDLMIIVTGLNLANNLIQKGDANALVNATGQIGNFIDNLSGFYEGTDTTLGDSLRSSVKINRPNERDTHIIKAHKDEMIIGVDKMKKMPKGITQDEVVNSVLMADNIREFETKATLKNVVVNYNDDLIKAVEKVEQRLSKIEMPHYQFNYDELNKMAVETIKTNNKIIVTKKKIGGLFS